MVLEYVLNKNNINKETDIEIINNISFESTAGAFSADIGDYTVEFEPTASALEESQKGYVVASLGTESGYVPYTVYMAKQSFIDKNPEIIQKFTNAIYRAQLWMKDHSSAEIAEVIAPHFTESSIETLTKIIDRYNQQDTWKSTPDFDSESLELIEDIMELSGELEKRVPFDDFIINDFANKAIKTIE